VSEKPEAADEKRFACAACGAHTHRPRVCPVCGNEQPLVPLKPGTSPPEPKRKFVLPQE
jgi:primosomal protein N'